MKKKYFITFGVVLLILILDQCVKIWVKTHIAYDDPSISLLGNWFQLNFVENQGMAFGTKLGSGLWGKLALSIFRIIAIVAISIYVIRQIKQRKASVEFLIVAGLILAGATGNLIDSLFYDYFFKGYFDPCVVYNQMHGSGIWANCTYHGFTQRVEIRHTGFLFGNVVDMFQFNVRWPEWMPWLGGQQVFPAIWNVADASISVGVVMVLFRQKKYFPKMEDEKIDSNPHDKGEAVPES